MLLKHWLAAWSSHHRTTTRIARLRRQRRRSPALPAEIELLEDRTLLTLFTVTTLFDQDNGGSNVSSASGDGGLSLREAVRLSNQNLGGSGQGQTDGDVILFSSAIAGGTIFLDPFFGQLVITDDLRIDGTDQDFSNGFQGLITVSGNNAVRVFQVNSAAAPGFSDVEFANLRITNGNAFGGSGGGIQGFSGSSMTLDNVSVLNNTAGTFGGGVVIRGMAAVRGSFIDGNVAAESSGGIDSSATLIIENSTISRNTAGTFSGAGSLFAGSNESITITNSTISQNTAASDAGGLFLSGGTSTITGTTFDQNSTGGRGGALFLNIGVTSDVSFSTFIGNSAASSGGAIENFGTLNLNSTTIGDFRSEPGDTWEVAGANAGDLLFAYTDTQNATEGFGTDLEASANFGFTSIEFDFGDGPRGGGVIAGAVVPQSGSVFLDVGASFSAVDSYQLYTSLVNPAFAFNEFEFGDTAFDATFISPETLVNGAAAVNDVDFYAIHLFAGDRIVVMLDGDPENDFLSTTVDLAIIDRDGFSFLPNSGFGFGDATAAGAVTVSQTGTYYVRVANNGFGGGAGTSYRFVAKVVSPFNQVNELEPNDFVFQATPLASFQFGQGAIRSLGRNTALLGGGIYNSSTGSVTIDGGSIQNNEATGAFSTQGGGAIFNSGGTVTTRGFGFISSNQASGQFGRGGGIFNTNAGTLNLLDTSLLSNTALGAGGGIADRNGASVSLSNVAVQSNQAGEFDDLAGDGGGLHVEGNSLIDIVDGSVRFNFAARNGGGIWNSSTGFDVFGTRLSNNSTGQGNGGGIYNSGGSLSLDALADFTGNRATGNGGGIYNEGNGFVDLFSSTLSENSADNLPFGEANGGAIFNRSGTVSIFDSTLSGNSAGNSFFFGEFHGGAIFNDDLGTLRVFDSTFLGNFATRDGGAIYNLGTADVNGTQFGNTEKGTDVWQLQNQNAGELVFAYVDTRNSLFAGRGFDATLTLLANDGTTEIEFDDDDGPSFQSPLIAGAEISQTGGVFFQIDGADGSAIDPYQLYTAVVDPAAALAEFEFNNTTATANAITENRLITGGVAPNDVDFFSFTANAGDTIVVMMDDDPDNDGFFTNTDLSLLDESGFFLDFGNNLSFSDGNGVGAFTAFSGGTFYVRVQNFGFSDDTDYRFVVRVYPPGSPVTELEPNNEAAEATLLTETQFGQGALSAVGQNAAQRGGAIFNAFDPFAGSAHLTVIDSSFQNNVANSLITGEGGGGIYNAGELTLDSSTVSGNTSQADGGGVLNAASGVLDAFLTTFSGNVAENDGGALANFGLAGLDGVTITDRSLADDPRDVWETPNVNGGDLIFAFVDTQQGFFNTDSTLSVQASDGTLIEFDDDDGAGFLSSVVAGAQVPQTGSVFYEITDNNNFSPLEQYELYVAAVNPFFALPESEGNGAFFTANFISENVLITGNVSGFDEDYFALVANAGDTIVVMMDDDPDGDGQLTDTDLILYGPDGSTFLAFGNNFSLADGNAAIQLSVAESGTYYVRVGDGGFGTDTEYRFVAQVISPFEALNEAEPNDDRANATRIDPGLFGSGNLTERLLNSGVPNSAERGGGLYNTGTLTASFSTIENNVAAARGGGLFNDNGGSATLLDSFITNNFAAFGGGGIATTNLTTLNLDFTNLDFNSTGESGGGLLIDGPANVTISGGTVNDNSAAGNFGGGGGIYNAGGALVLREFADVSGNTSTGFDNRGGGIYNLNGTVVIEAGTISRNSASFGGGLASEGADALLLLTPTPFQEGTTVFANFADRDGGGIHNAFGSILSLTLANVSSNRTDNGNGGGIFNSGTAFITSGIIGNEDLSVETSDVWTVPGANAGDLIFAYVDTQRSFDSERDIDSTLTILDNDGNFLAFDDDGGSGLNSAVSGVTVPVNQTGNVFFDVQNFGSPDAMDYDLYVAVVNPATAIAETEFNNDIFSANAIPTNRLITGNLANGFDVDVFSFAVPAAGTSLVVMIDQMQAFGLTVEILDPNGFVVADNFGFAAAIGSVTAATEGTYFVRVSGGAGDYQFVAQAFQPGGGGGTLGIDPILNEAESNDTLAAAQSLLNAPFNLSPNANVHDASLVDVSQTIPHLTISGTGDGTFDYYSFTANAGDRGIFDIDGASFDTELFLYDGNGNLLANDDDAAQLVGLDPGSDSFLNSFIEYTFSTTGTYFIGVGRFNSTGSAGGITGEAPPAGAFYTLQVAVGSRGSAIQEAEPNDDPDTATALPRGRFGQGSLDQARSNRARSGGGILNVGTLTISAGVIKNNEATGTDPFNGGGGLANAGTLVLLNSTRVESNVALGAAGGGILNRGFLNLNDSMVFGNSTTDNGGGIANLAGATAEIVRSTIGSVADTNDTWVSRNVNNGDLVFAYVDSLNNFEARPNLSVSLDEGSRLLETDSGENLFLGSVVAGAEVNGLQPTPAGKTNDVFFDVRSAVPDQSLPDYNLYVAVVNPINAIPDLDNNDTADTAQALPTSAAGTFVTGTLLGNDVDVFRVDNVPLGSRIVVIMDNDPDNNAMITDTELELFDRIEDRLDPQNTMRERLLGFGNDFTSAEGTAASAISLPDSSGRYFIRITNGFFPADTTYRFVVLVLPLQNEILESESNNTPGTADELPPGQFGRGGLLVLDGNQADGSGGGLYNQGNITLESSTVGLNTANLDGGGLANDGTVYVRRSTFENNQAFANGGAISNRSALELRNTTLSGNNALGNGGGLDLMSPLSSVGILHSTITNNVATFGEGGGVFRPFFEENGQLILFSSIVSGNFHEAGGSRFSDLFGSVSKDSAFNFIGVGDTQTGLANNVNFNVVGSLVNSPFTSYDPLLGPLDDNGGPTRTHALQLNSPALLFGPPMDFFNVSTDQRGIGFQRLFGPTIDIGAFELQSATGGQLDIVVTATVALTLPGGGPGVFGPSALVNDPVSFSTVTIRDPFTNQVSAVITPYPGFSGEIRVASADVSGDGFPDVITVPGPGALAFIRAFSGRTQFIPGTSTVLYNVGDPVAFTPFGVGFAAFGPFAGGAFIAAADMFISPQMTGGQALPGQDGTAEIVVSADFGGGPHVRVFDGLSGAIIRDFFAYEVGVTSGVRVAVGDLSGDGIPDIITAPGPGVPSHVRVFNTVSFAFSSQASGQLGVAISGLAGIPPRLANFFPFELTFTGGTFIAAGRIDEDSVIDIVSSRGVGFAEILVNSGLSGEFIGTAFAFPFSFIGGARVALSDVNGDGLADLFVAPAIAGTANEVRVFLGLALVNRVRLGSDPFLTPLNIIFAPGNSGIAASNRAARGSGGRSRSLHLEADFTPPLAAETSLLTPQQLETIVRAAQARLIAAGVPAEAAAVIDQVEWRIADLPDEEIARTVGGTILIDLTAGGFGWFIDPTPLADEEFTPEGFFAAPEPDRRRVDLLTVVLHELAHVFGAEHVDEADDPDHLLLDRLPPGRRRLTDGDDLEAFFSSQHLETLFAEIG